MRVAVGAAPRSGLASFAQQAIACTFFAALVAACARVAVPLPFTPVPFTLGPLAIALTGMFLGSRGAFFALLEYLAAGTLGAPVFAGGGGGLAYMASVSSLGYLLAYPAAAFVTGWIAERSGLRFSRLLLAAIAGLLVVYAGGDAYLAVWMHGNVGAAVVAGTLPFIIFDAGKAVIAAGVASRASASWFSWRAR
jgi:biotin transport system substrate-specific component